VGHGNYTIDIFSLSNGLHEFHFDFGNQLFSNYEESIVNEGEGTVKVVLNRSETMIETEFEIAGKVLLTCDRSLKDFWMPIDVQKRIVFKFGEDWKELSDDLITVPRNIQRIDLSQYVYEYISLVVPMKKIHPAFEDKSSAEGEFVYTSKSPAHNANGQTDPRWNELKKIKK